MAKKKKAEPKAAVEEVETGVTVEQHLKDLGLLGGEEQAAIDKAMSPLSETELKALDSFLALEPVEELFEVNLFDVTPVQINGGLQHLAKGSQKVSKQIYNVLKDANLV